jgi:uroporphyrinogen-III decarboxylase
MTEKFTPFERFAAVRKGEEPDRVPIGWLGHYELGIGLPRVKVSEVVRDRSGRLLYKGIKAVYERYKPDTIAVFTYTIVEAVAMGTKPIYYDTNPPGPLEYVVKEPKDLDLLKIPDPRFDGDLPCIYNATKMVVREYGNKLPIQSNTVGPFAVAARVRGLWEICYDCMRRPWFAHDLLEHATEASINIAECYAREGIDAIGWGAGSETCISVRHFSEFVLPYDRRFVRAVRREGVLTVSRHLCSGPNAFQLADEYLKSSPDGPYTIWGLFESPKIMAEKKEKFRKMVPNILLGGAPSTALVQLGKPEEIISEVKRWIKNVAPTGNYVFIGDCGIPAATPMVNVDAYVKAAKEAGRYPIKT